MYRDRLIEIVEFAYALLRDRINGERISMDNEASLQLFLKLAVVPCADSNSA